jgi:rhomboid protease GluP
MCPHCRAFITTSDRVCPYCGERVGARAVDRQQSGEILGGLIPHAHFTTVLILLINAGFYAATAWYGGSWINIDGNALRAFGAKDAYDIVLQHEWWRLVTAGFLHGGLLHIGMNSWVLYDLGAQVEQFFGTPRFLVLYFAGTVGGFWLSLELNPQALSIGASAGLTGLIGAMIAFGVVNRSAVGAQIRNFYVRWVVYILAIGFIGGFGIDNWAHIGGVIAGFAVGYVAGTPMHSSREREGVWRALAAVCVLVTVYCFWLVYLHFPAANPVT